MAPPLSRRLRRLEIQITQIFVWVFGFWCLVFGESAQPAKYVRVQIVENAGSLSFKAEGAYEITDSGKKKILASGKNLKVTVVAHKGGILLAGKNFNTNKLFIKTRDPDITLINGKAFRGDIELVRDGAGLSAINFIELEDYVKGISIREISHYWPPEALKASAIAFRTFALYKIEEGKGRDYDLTSDIYSQVYSGKAAERYRITQAVDETRGMALTYRGKIFPAFYHATCAGHTEDASVLWNIDIAPLKGVHCDFCKDSPHFRWHGVFTLEELADKLSKAGYATGKIQDIAVLGKDISGRITDLKIISDKKEMKIVAKDFRNVIGPNLIKSTNFSLSVVNHDVVFEGFGWGHGVGLCQWGAYFMAKQGYKFEEILKYYYPGSDVKTIGF